VTDIGIESGEWRDFLPSVAEIAKQRAVLTKANPPLPGIAWNPSYNMHGDQVDATLEIRREFYTVYAPPADQVSEAGHRVAADPTAGDLVGRAAYAAWREALPEIVRQQDALWDALPPTFRGPMTAAARMAWQFGENAGYTQALAATLPSAKLGAAGELLNLSDAIGQLMDASEPGKGKVVQQVQLLIVERVRQLREEASIEARRERDTHRRRHG
jgi:hypothetical protein